MKSYTKYVCHMCGRLISNAGFAYAAHHKACLPKYQARLVKEAIAKEALAKAKDPPPVSEVLRSCPDNTTSGDRRG